MISAASAASDRCPPPPAHRAGHGRGLPAAGHARAACPTSLLDSVERAIADIAAGRPVVVVDDADRENEGDIIFAASKATPELMAFMIRHTSGVICVPLPGEDLDRLQLPLMTAQNNERMRHRLHDQRGRPRRRHHRHLRRRPGQDGPDAGRLGDRALRAGPARARLPAALHRGRRAAPARPHRGRGRPGPAGRADARRACWPRWSTTTGPWPGCPQLRAFADEHGLALISIAQLIEYRRHSERMIRRVVETRLPNAHGEWRALGYQNSTGRDRARRAGATATCGDGERTSWSGCTRNA